MALREQILEKIKEGMPGNVRSMIDTSPRILKLLEQSRASGGLPSFMKLLEYRIKKVVNE